MLWLCFIKINQNCNRGTHKAKSRCSRKPVFPSQERMGQQTWHSCSHFQVSMESTQRLRCQGYLYGINHELHSQASPGLCIQSHTCVQQNVVSSGICCPWTRELTDQPSVRAHTQVETGRRPGWKLYCLHCCCPGGDFSCVLQNTAFSCCMLFSLWSGEALKLVLSSMHMSNPFDWLCWKLGMCLSALPFFFVRGSEHFSELQRLPSDSAST